MSHYTWLKVPWDFASFPIKSPVQTVSVWSVFGESVMPPARPTFSSTQRKGRITASPVGTGHAGQQKVHKGCKEDLGANSTAATLSAV